MAENVTSVLDKDEAGEHKDSDVFYVIQGTGPKRDRWTTLGRIKSFIQDSLKYAIHLVGSDGQPTTCDIDHEKIMFANPGNRSKYQISINSGFTYEVDGNVKVKLSEDEFKIKWFLADQTGLHVMNSDWTETAATIAPKIGTQGKIEGALISGKVEIKTDDKITAQQFTATNDNGGSSMSWEAISVGGRSGSTEMTADGVETDGLVHAAEVKAGRISASTEGQTAFMEYNAVAVSNREGSTKMTAGGIETSGTVKGWLSSKHYATSSNDQTTVHSYLTDKNVTVGTIIPAVAKPDVAASWVNFYGPSGDLLSVSVLKNHAVLLVCTGITTVGGTNYPAWVSINDTNT